MSNRQAMERKSKGATVNRHTDRLIATDGGFLSWKRYEEDVQEDTSTLCDRHTWKPR